MKKISLLVLSIIALAVSVKAQVPVGALCSPLAFGPLAAASTTNFVTPLLITASKQGFTGVQFTLSMSAAGASVATNAAFWLAPTCDGITYDTNHPSIISLPTLGTSTNTWITNLNSQGIFGWFVYAAQNTHSAAVATNRGSQFVQKISAP